MTLLVDVASAPDDAAILRTIEYREEVGTRLLVNLPPYPSKAPKEIETGEETLARIVAALEATPPPRSGKVPVRTLVYAGLGDEAERNLTSTTRIYQLYRRLFMLLGPNAFNRLGAGGLPVEVQALKEEGRTVGKFQMLGDYRWYPSEENIAKAKRELDAVQGQPYLRGFSYGDEVSLSAWSPKDGRDDGLRSMLQAKGFQPEDVMPADDAASVTRRPLDQRWRRIRFVDDEEDARKTPSLYVESRRYIVGATLDRLAAASGKLKEAFGDEIVYGPNFSPHPFFWPELALFVQAFRRGAINRASHSDYWWQVGELGPQMAGFLLDVFRAGLRDRPGVIQAYAMPHSPGTTDADFRRSVVTSIAHGAKALDYFQVTPEQANTENYIRHDDLSRYLTRPRRDVRARGGGRPDRGWEAPAGDGGDRAVGEHGPVGSGDAGRGRGLEAGRRGRFPEHGVQHGAEVPLDGAPACPGAGRHRGRRGPDRRERRAVPGAVPGGGSALAERRRSGWRPGCGMAGR